MHYNAQEPTRVSGVLQRCKCAELLKRSPCVRHTPNIGTECWKRGREWRHALTTGRHETRDLRCSLPCRGHQVECCTCQALREDDVPAEVTAEEAPKKKKKKKRKARHSLERSYIFIILLYMINEKQTICSTHI